MKSVPVLLVLMLAGICRSQPVTTELSYPEGSIALDLVRSPSNRLFLATHNCLYRLDPDSKQWLRSLPGGWRVKVGALDKNLYASAYGQLYMSTDDGMSWSMLEPAIEVPIMDFAVADSNRRMFASSPSDGKSRSYNAVTKKYDVRPLKPYYDSIRVFYRADSNMFVFTGSENWDTRSFFQYTTDLGQTWSSEGWLLGAQDWTHVAFYKDSLYQTTNRSLHRIYGHTLVDLPGFGNRFKKVFVDCGGILAITHEGKPALSIDGGRTWDSTSLPAPMEMGLPGCDGVDYLPARLADVKTIDELHPTHGTFFISTPSTITVRYYNAVGQVVDAATLGRLIPGVHRVPMVHRARFYEILDENRGCIARGKLVSRVKP